MSTTDRQTMNGKPVFTVPAKTIINFKSKFDKKLLCDGITFTAGSACTYSCAFCYVPDMQRKQQDWFKAHGVQGDHMDVVIRNKDAVELARKQIESKSWTFRQQPYVIYSSPKVDVAGNMELVRETVEICKVILTLTNWHIRLLSKSNLLPVVAKMLHKWNWDGKDINNPNVVTELTASDPVHRVIYGVSTGTLDDNLAKAFEQGTPLVSKRIESLHWLQDNGYRTFGMVCPSLPQDHYDKFAEDMAAALRYDRMEHVWAEVINARGESFTRTWKALTDGGFHNEAEMLRNVSTDPDAKFWWEAYAKATFLAHASVCPPSKLRFLQYTTKDTDAWWQLQKPKGAVLL